MAEQNNAQNQQEATQAAENAETKAETTSEKTFTQADIDAAIAEAKEQWKAGLKEQLENAKSEGEKLAKMTAAEREKEEQRIEREKFEKEKAEFERKSIVAEVKSQLADKSLPVSFADMIAGSDAEQSKANIDAFEKAWNSAVEAAVKSKLSGKTPNIGGVQSNAEGADFFSVIKENQRI